MKIDEEDIERAGTRSRRQLSNSKQYSVYPPQDPSLQDAKKASQRFKHFLQRKSRSLILICIVAIVFLVLGFLSGSYSMVNKSTRTKASTFEETVHFKDSSQFADYAFLNRLLPEKKGLTSSRFDLNRIDAIRPGQDSFVGQLSKNKVAGHTFDELRRLTNKIPLPTTSTSNKQYRRVPVTAIIHTKTVTQLYIQVQSVLTQTALPEYIWIICDTDQKYEVDARIMTLDRRRVKVMARDNVDAIPHQWLQAAAHVSTEFVWIIDQDIAPGKRYLENLLKLSYTKQYKSTLLGTEAALLSAESQGSIECMPASINSGSRQMKSKAVDMVNDSWLLRRSWIPFLVDEINIGNTTAALDTFTGLFISRALYMNGGIPSIALPTDPIERAYWGDVRLQKTKKSATCNALETFLSDEQANDYDALSYRNTVSKTTATGPMLFYVDSVDNLEELAVLLCKFENKQEVDLHVVTGGSGKGLSDQQVRSSLSNLCGKSSVDLIVHDISMLHTVPNWNLLNGLFHRLVHIMTVVQPQILIHTVDQENALFTSIKSASEITDVTSIYLPTQDIPHALWMAELPIGTLLKWNTFTIKILINTDKKPHALARLLNSATSAHYFGDDVDLTILMDHSSDQVTQTFANNFNWKRGIKSVRHRIAQASKSHLFAESWYPANNDEYAIILNNDIELSRYYYGWVKYAILRYRYMEPEKTKNVFGISLYAPPLIETDPSGRHLFNPSHVLTKAGYSKKSNEPYLMQWPSHSGAVFFPEHWREFHDYITARIADIHGFDMQDVTVPDLRSNEWIKSWRRYFEELIYLRSYVMLYPNFKENSSLSTQHLELRKKAMREEYAQATAIYNVPLMDDKDEITELQLPFFEDLPVLDIWGKLSNHNELKERGLDLHNEISACPAPIEGHNQYDPTDLLCPHAMIVTVDVENQDDPVPELPTREVTVYI